MQIFLAQALCIKLQLHSLIFWLHKLKGNMPFIEFYYHILNLDSSKCYSLHSLLSHFFFSNSSSSDLYHSYSIIKYLTQSPK